MQEFTTTRNNPMIDPNLALWGWEIPVYLFIGGIVAGMMIISGYFLFKGRYTEKECSCFYLPYISFFILNAGMLALFLDLEHKIYFWRLYTTFEITSPMSWGAWILLIVYPALFANMLMRIPNKIEERFPFLKSISERMMKKKQWIKNLGIINIFLGLMLGAYTGILLSALGARPLWSSAILWLLFIVSGLSAAAAFVHLIAKDVYERELLAKADNTFLIAELFVIAFFIIGLLSSTTVHQQAALLLLNGEFAASFWVFVIGMGIIIPLFIQLLAVNHKIQHTPVAPIMVIIGGLILRFIIVNAGQYSHWMK